MEQLMNGAGFFISSGRILLVRSSTIREATQILAIDEAELFTFAGAVAISGQDCLLLIPRISKKLSLRFVMLPVRGIVILGVLRGACYLAIVILLFFLYFLLLFWSESFDYT